MGSIVEQKRVGKDGKTIKVFRAYIRRTGYASQSKVCATKTEAKEWLRDNEATPLLRKRAKGAGILFEKLVKLFTAAPPDKGTKYWSPGHLDFWLEWFDGRSIGDITHGDINAGKAELQTREAVRATPDGPRPAGKTLEPATVNRYLASLSSVFNFALKRGLIDAHPMKAGKVSKLEESEGRTRILTEKEAQRLMDAAHEARWQMMPLFLLMLLTTGARKSEVRNLKWQQVNLAESVAVLHKTKNGRARALPLVAEVRAALEEAKKVRPINSHFVFFDPLHPERAKSVDSTWKAVRQRAGLWKDRDDRLDQVVLHTTRHSAVTKMLKGGANLSQAAAVSGHKTLSQLKRYEHLAAQDSVELAERLLGNGGKTAA